LCDDRGATQSTCHTMPHCGHSGVIHIKYRIFLISSTFPYCGREIRVLFRQLDVSSFAWHSTLIPTRTHQGLTQGWVGEMGEWLKLHNLHYEITFLLFYFTFHFHLHLLFFFRSTFLLLLYFLFLRLKALVWFARSSWQIVLDIVAPSRVTGGDMRCDQRERCDQRWDVLITWVCPFFWSGGIRDSINQVFATCKKKGKLPAQSAWLLPIALLFSFPSSSHFSLISLRSAWSHRSPTKRHKYQWAWLPFPFGLSLSNIYE